MNNIVTNFAQILDFARQSKVPVEKKRGIVREYLQSKFISVLYSFSGSRRLSFVGGTSLRLLRDLPRFSEDLDFDVLNRGLSNTEVRELVAEVVRRFQSEGLNVEFYAHEKEGKTYLELRFPNLLFELKITSNSREKLMIKFDYSSTWKGQSTDVVLLNKYGFIENVVVNKLDQTIVQKMAAYIQRNLTQPRDVYDIVWLYSQGARPDIVFAKENGLADIVVRARKRHEVEGISDNFKKKLLPFLFDIEDIRRLDLFGSVLGKL